MRRLSSRCLRISSSFIFPCGSFLTKASARGPFTLHSVEALVHVDESSSCGPRWEVRELLVAGGQPRPMHQSGFALSPRRVYPGGSTT